MRRFAPPLLVVLFAISSASGATPQQVDDAIRKAKAYLRSQQQPGGGWPANDATKNKQDGGHTAVATLALLVGGDNPQDEHMRKAIDALEKLDTKGTYVLGLRAQVWQYLPPSPRRRLLVERDAKILQQGVDRDGRWGYSNTRKGGHNSTSQYGVLGMWACAQLGYEVPSGFWQRCEQGWQECQSPTDGGWSYRSVVPNPSDPKTSVTATMTAAGVASLFITQEYLRSNAGIVCKGNVTNSHIEAGMKWMSDHFQPKATNGYLLYGIERIGVASGNKYFGEHDWYAAGADALVKKQAKDGSWNSHGTIPGTAFGIFFLTHGRATVVMNKLRYEFAEGSGKGKDADAHWNQRPRDAANVAQWVGRTMERELNWQVVNLRVGATDLLDAPILYVSGDQDLTRIAADDRAKLKTFVEQGGLILGSADCGSAAFAKSFQQVGRELFPAYSFRPLPAGHPILSLQQYPASKWKSKPELLGLSNGTRELMLLLPGDDFGKSWQTRASRTKSEHFELATNIFLYAVDKKHLRFKGETYVITPDKKAKPRKTIKLARIQYGGNWDPEPGGWRRLATHLLNTHRTTLTVDPVQLDNPDALAGYRIAHLTGTAPFKLDPASAEVIRNFVQKGGTLVIDAAGGSTAFAESAERELNAMFKSDAADQLVQPLPPTHALYNLPASKVTSVDYRNFARERIGRSTKTPRIFGITLKNRAAVLYSKEDLSTGLVGQPVDGVAGYEPESATQLMTNVILYAAGEGKAPSTKPSKSSKPTSSNDGF